MRVLCFYILRGICFITDIIAVAATIALTTLVACSYKEWSYFVQSVIENYNK